MDPSSIITQMFSQLISTYWLLIFLLSLLVFLKSPFMKGILSELQINLATKLFLDKKIYTLFKNVILPIEDSITQIDHVIVSRYGVLVIKTKNMKGWIFISPQHKPGSRRITGIRTNSRICYTKITSIPKRCNQLWNLIQKSYFS